MVGPLSVFIPEFYMPIFATYNLKTLFDSTTTTTNTSVAKICAQSMHRLRLRCMHVNLTEPLAQGYNSFFNILAANWLRPSVIG